MSKSKNLAKFSAEQLEKFFASFDVVFSDIDGVIWHFGRPIKGAIESLIALSKLGKTVYLVTNNSTYEIKYFIEKFRRGGLEINPDNIINTSKVIIWYLKKIDFHGDIFVIASEPFRNNLQKAGITMVEQPKVFPMNASATISELQDRPSVKAVITDFDYYCDWAKMALAISCLKRKEVIYLTGAQDKWVGEKKSRVLGPGSMLDVISNLSGKEPITCAKPSHILKNYIWDTYNVSNPRRCLFIGDTLQQDMKFGSMCGFLKLFVGSGCDSLEEALEEEDTYPDYYIPSLGQLFSF
ncbi:phosphoglycolate phosphatase 1A, chloroplastic-like [Odontomachus brunneus]|uniref:phosphoglycolate phosphatase 1A, chloroplastic-like n=1 Tax=Odontomachus brunneus TaxID=486640 RepID=UPI0013F1BB4A|nr:phosphoglycolate phosphatase 1A, chloroplastic-like [Odontomachus brunneus]